MSNNALYTIEQVDNKLIITVEAVKAEHPNPTMIRSNDGNTETIEFVNPPLTINTNQGGLDLSKYKRFPKGYVIPKGVKVIAVSDDRETTHGNYSKGKIGVTVDSCDLPYVDFNEETYTAMRSHELAPLDPSDHPDYKPDQPDLPETRPMNAEEIGEWTIRCLESGLSRKILVHHINALVQYELNKAKR